MDTVNRGQAGTASPEEPQFDARGLVELNARVPRVSEIDGERANFDAGPLTTRQTKWPHQDPRSIRVQCDTGPPDSNGVHLEVVRRGSGAQRSSSAF